MNLQGKHALVIGLGKSGLAAVRFLLAQGAIVTATDQRSRQELMSGSKLLQDLPVALYFGPHLDSLLLAQDLVVPSPGVPWDLPLLERARQQGIATGGELELAAGNLEGHVIGVTGTNGKTTTTLLIDHILRDSGIPGMVAGNIGMPVLKILDEAKPGHWHALELSSFQLEASTSFRSHIAVVLNITPDHLDRHHDFTGYVDAKSRILNNQQKDDFVILNEADEHCLALAEKATGCVVFFGAGALSENGAHVSGNQILFRGETVSDIGLPVKGRHNLENALAAVAATALAGVELRSIGRSLKTFQPVPHRMEYVGAVQGVEYYNDSKATNVAAAAKACESFDKGLWVILGGQDKGSDYRPLSDVLRERARAALLIGEAAPLIRSQLNGSIHVVDLETLPEAVGYAQSHAKAGDSVLLAPACASFDQFLNYMERGEAFRHLVGGIEA